MHNNDWFVFFDIKLMFSASAKPDISFIISTPFSSPIFIVDKLRVSSEIFAFKLLLFFISFIDGMTLLCSSSADILIAPGLDDSPPKSRIEAPSLSILVAVSTAEEISFS